MKKFLEELEKELVSKGVSKSEIDDIIKDHKEMIDEAIREGLTEEEIENKFGSPKNVAEEVSRFSDSADDKQPKVEGYTLYKSFVASTDYSVSIHLVNEDFELVGGNGEEIEVYYHGKGDLSQYDISFEKNEFSMKETKSIKNVFWFRRENQISFLIKLPKYFISNCSLVTVNADEKIHKIKTGLFELKSTNGDVEIFDIECAKFKVDTVNGDMSLKRISTESIQFMTVSGDVEMENIECDKDLSVNAVSGDIRITDSTSGDCSFHSVSGDVSGINFYPKSISLKSVSGDLEIRNDDLSRVIEIKSKKSVSGDIKIGKK